MLCLPEGNKRQHIACGTSQGSACKLDTSGFALHWKKKMLPACCYSQFCSFEFFIFLIRLSSTQSTALYSVCVSFLFSGAGEVLQTALFEMVNSMLWDSRHHCYEDERQPAGKAFIYFTTPTPLHATRAMRLVLDEYFIINVKAAVRWPQHCTQWPASSLLSALAAASRN